MKKAAKQLRSALRWLVFLGVWAPALALAAPDDLVTVLYVNGIATSAAQAHADRDALAQAIATSTLRPSYPQSIEVDNQYNPTNGTSADVAELVTLKTNEERYLGQLWRGFIEGSDAPVVVQPASLINIYDSYLSQDPATIRSVVQRIVTRWTSALQSDARRKLVLVGHSQGNFIVNWAWLGLFKNLGDEALQRVRVVNVASATVWSPFGLDVTLAEDHGVFSFLPKQGRSAPRDTPFCRSTGRATGCPFMTATATVASGSACTTPLGAAPSATRYCHNFRATYLGNTLTRTIATQRLAAAAYTREGNELKQRLIDTVFTAIDSLDKAIPAGWRDDLFGEYFGNGATSSATGSIVLQGRVSQPRATAVGKQTFDQGLQASWSGCLTTSTSGENWVMLDLTGRDGLMPPSTSQQSPPLWALGFHTRAADPDTLLIVFGQSATPRLDKGSEVFAAHPTQQGNAYCGAFELAIGADGHGSARFVNDAGGAALSWRSTQPVTAGAKRMHLSALRPSTVSVDALVVQDVPFEPPFP